MSCFKKCLALAAAICGLSASVSAAEPIYQTDVPSASTGCTMLGFPGFYSTEVETALAMVNHYRKEACEEGVQNPCQRIYLDKCAQTYKRIWLFCNFVAKWCYQLC